MNWKIKHILIELFDNRQKKMAEALGVSTTKISLALNDKQTLTYDSVKILLTDYNIDPHWFFNEDDDTPIRFQSMEKLKPYSERINELTQQNNIIMEQLVEYQSREIIRLKNSTELPPKT